MSLSDSDIERILTAKYSYTVPPEATVWFWTWTATAYIQPPSRLRHV